MPPVNQVAPSADADNESTAELPVLDVASYEASLNDSGVGPVAPGAVEATMEMPAITSEQLPTLPPAPYDLDQSGTHEMPQLPQPSRPAATAPVVSATAAVARAATNAIPPSPPLIEELRKALACAEARIVELNERARIADAERTVAVGRANAEAAQLREQSGDHLDALQTAGMRLGVQGADQAGLEDELFARAARITALEREAAAQAGVLAARNAALASSERRCEELACEGKNLLASIARRDSQIAMLEADLVARQEKLALISRRLEVALASTDPHVPQLRAEIEARDEQIRLLKLDVELARTQTSEKDADLQVAEESIRNLENEVRDKTGKLEEANVTVEEWRAVIAESQRSILQRDSRIQQLEADLGKRPVAGNDSSEHTSEEVLLEGPARVLIRTDGNTDFVHVLGRRTRIGRGSDNEIVLDTKHISRYHAVLLAGPVHTSIEDLNSTNGVFVNGKRVSRQVLKDGDKVTVGRTQYRYTVRD